MLNYIKNRITIYGKDVEKIIQNHIRTIDGKILFDFDTILKMPEELLIENGIKAEDGLRLAIAKRDPNNKEIGTKNEKMSNSDLYDFLEQTFATDMINIFILTNVLNSYKNVQNLKNIYQDNFDEVMELGEKCIKNLQKYGSMDWFDWRIKNWGAPSNARKTNISKNIIEFQSEWDPPFPVIEKFAKMYPELEIIHDYAEERIGYLAGSRKYVNGELDTSKIFDIYSKEAFELAFDLWHCQNKFVFDSKKNTYVLKKYADAQMD